MSREFYEGVSDAAVPPYIIAEIGSNHNGDMVLAREMIAAAKECGCDAAKFQSWSPSSLICAAEYERNQKYYDSPKKHFGSLREMAEKYYLRPEQHRELAEYCARVGIDFCSSHFSSGEADLLCEVGVKFFKIASMDINNDALLSYTATLGRPILLSTGMATLAEIDRAVRLLEQNGCRKIIVLHCISLYPPQYDAIHLRNIPMLAQTFGYPIGFSDHSLGSAIPMAAVALGAKVIEKHFTTDNELPGWDHEMSANPRDMKNLVDSARAIFSALGSSRRLVSPDEQEKSTKFRRSVVATKRLSRGSVVTAADVGSKRPGTGIRPDELQYILGRKLTRDIESDEQISWADFE